MEETSLRSDCVFSQLVDQYSDMVTRICLVRTGNYHDAQDCWQNVFLKLYQKKAYLYSPEKVKFWLIRVTVNECKNCQRALFRKNTVTIDENLSVSDEGIIYELLDSLKRLPNAYREVVYLYYYENYSVNDIAEILNRRLNTVKSQLSRARKILEIDLKGESQ